MAAGPLVDERPQPLPSVESFPVAIGPQRLCLAVDPRGNSTDRLTDSSTIPATLR
jgi:hypothetical protein